MTRNIKAVTRSGIEASTKTHFNEIYIDPPGARLLAFPADGRNAPNTVEQLIMERGGNRRFGLKTSVIKLIYLPNAIFSSFS